MRLIRWLSESSPRHTVHFQLISFHIRPPIWKTMAAAIWAASRVFQAICHFVYRLAIVFTSNRVCYRCKITTFDILRHCVAMCEWLNKRCSGINSLTFAYQCDRVSSENVEWAQKKTHTQIVCILNTHEHTVCRSPMLFCQTYPTIYDLPLSTYTWWHASCLCEEKKIIATTTK